VSRATRPLRRVRGAERERLADRYSIPLECWDAWRWRGEAIVLRCRPSHLRRCLLGRVVSARAARKILAAACGRAG
jgi:hypothetical protein